MFWTRKLWAEDSFMRGLYKWLSHPFNATSFFSHPSLPPYFHTSSIRRSFQSYMKPSWHGKADRHAATRIRSRDQRIAEARLWPLALQCVDLPSLSVASEFCAIATMLANR